MRLRRARVHVVGGAPDAPIDGAHGPRARREGLLLALTDDRGHTGWGEASPLPGLSVDTMADAHAALDGLDVGSIAVDEVSLDAIAGAVAALPSTLPSARFALETALLDLAARSRDMSVAELLGAERGARRALSALLSGVTPDALAESAARAVRAGATTLKLKLDGRAPLGDNVARVRTVRSAARAPIALRLDANGTFDPARVTDTLAALAFAAPELVEEPVAGHALLALLAHPRSPIPIAVDESLATTDLALRDALLGAVFAVVLKPTLLGGLLACRALARTAQSRGVRAIVTHTLDGPVALAAAAALALALPRGLAHGLAPHPCLAAYPVAELDAIQGLELRVPEAPGLGVRGHFGAAA